MYNNIKQRVINQYAYKGMQCVVIALFFSACFNHSEELIELSQNSGSLAKPQITIREESKIPLPQGVRSYRIFNAFLSKGPSQTEQSGEYSSQIVAFKQGSEQVRVWIIEYAHNENRYILSNELLLRIEVLDSLNMVQKDLIGDLQQELYFTGFTHDGLQALDAYRLRVRPNGMIGFTNILSITASILIEVETPDQNAPDVQVRTNSSLITTLSSEVLADNTINIINTVYHWNSMQEQYIVHSSRIENEQVSRISEEHYDEQMLHGLWQESDSAVDDMKQQRQLFFQPGNEIIMRQGKRQEPLVWQNSQQDKVSGIISISFYNAIIIGIDYSMTVSWISENYIQVRFFSQQKFSSTYSWDGVYERMSEKELLAKNDKRISTDIMRVTDKPAPQLSGIFRGDVYEFFFNENRFTKRNFSTGEEEVGSFTMYILDRMILDLQYHLDNENKNIRYAFQYKEEYGELSIQRTIELTPIELFYNRSRVTGTTTLVLLQEEAYEEDEQKIADSDANLSETVVSIAKL